MHGSYPSPNCTEFEQQPSRVVPSERTVPSVAIDSDVIESGIEVSLNDS